jgi:hypothetical protein
MTSRATRRRTRTVAAALVAGCVAGALAAPAQTSAKLPAAAEIIRRHVEAMGGEKAFAAIRSIRETGTVEIPAQGIKGTFEILSARPSRLRQTIEVPGAGRIEMGYDGKVGWLIEPTAGPSLVTGRELAELVEDAEFDAPLHPAARYKELTTVERLEFNARPAFKVKVVYLSGQEQFEYFDVESGLQIGWEGQRATPSGVLPTVSRSERFSKFGDLMRPTLTTERQLGIDQVLTLSHCEFNGVPNSAFDLPAQIKALIK